MVPRDLNHQELLELDPGSGVIRFAGQRALLLDAVALGILQKELVASFGATAARTLLNQFGYAQGWRMADAMRSQVRWDEPDGWRRAGARIYALHGLFCVAPAEDALAAGGGLVLTTSYEAEQHLLHSGLAAFPVCWTVCGLVGGYLSRTSGQEIHVLESSCVGKGDATCCLVAKTREEWELEKRSDIQLPERRELKESLDVPLDRVTRTLRLAGRKLRRGSQAQQLAPHSFVVPEGMVAGSPPMRRLLDLALRAARVDSTVLITGESGSGKERIGRVVHDHSSRSGGPFLAVNCGAITDSLLESELFGHARGSFSGATHDREGLFEAAAGGTLLLDEVGDIPPGMQVKLLRAIQEREVRRVGENQSRPIDVRIVAATNRDLAYAVASGAFRQDLYYRLKVMELHLPSLRERQRDILPLARRLIDEAAAKMKRTVADLAPAAADQLLGYPWPGNVRELENTMERAVALARGPRVELEDLPEEVREAVPQSILQRGAGRTLADVKKQHVLSVLFLNGGNRARTAAQLQIGPATLYRRLKTYGVTSGVGGAQKTVLVRVPV